MKKYIFLIMAIVLSLMSANAQTVSIADVTLHSGETKVVSINLENTQSNIVSFQMDLSLPEGITINKAGCELGGRITDEAQELVIGKQPNGSIRLTSTSLTLTPIEGTSGEIIKLSLTAANDAKGGTASLSNIKLATSDSQRLTPEDSSFQIGVTYTLIYKVDGDIYKTDSIVYNSALTPIPEPTKEGYTFSGWSDIPATMPANDVVITGTFSINQYTMTFVLDNGQENVVKTQDYASELTAPADPVKTGFTFKGWNPAVPATIPATDMTFTAQWERNKYLVTFIVEDTVAKKDSVLYEGAITKPADPVKEGYTFTGWQPGIPETMPANDLTFTAQFSINQYTMTFVLDNGQENIVKTQDYGTALTAPENPVKTGFTFKGWTPAVPATVPASDMTFTAQWERNKYKVTWIVDGQSTVDEVEYEATIVKPEDPVKEGYTFTGWDNEIPETMPANDLTFTAQFKINTYAVIYMVKGEEWARDSLDYGATIVKRNYTAAEDETFNGWVSDAEYTTMPAHDVVYTAQITSGIVELQMNKECVTIYRLDGTLVARNMKLADAMKKLTKGVYIINGKKVNIKLLHRL